MKRVFILLAVMLCAMMAFSAMAVETNAGETVVVPIYVNTAGASQITLTINFDTDLFEYSAIRCEGPGGQATFNTTKNEGRMTMYDITSPIEAGRVGTITLVVKEDVEFGTYGITVSLKEAWDIDENPVEVEVSADEIIVKCPHAETKEVIVKEPDCVNDGEKQFVCVECGEVAKKEVILAPGHQIVFMEAVEASCTKDGLTEGEMCSACGEVLVVQLVVPAIGHNVVEDEAIAATCTKDGRTAGSHCSNCDEILVAQDVIPATGHSEGEWVITIQPTTEEQGIKEKYCTVCNDVLDTKTIPVLEKSEDIADPVVETIEAKIDDVVTLNVFVSSNKAAVVTVELSYDETVFEFVSEASNAGLVKDGRYLVYSLTDIINGKIGTVTLKVKDTAKDGVHTIVAEVTEAFDFDENPVATKAAVDKVSIKTRIPGDVTGDGLVDGRDLLRLAKHIGGYEVDIIEANATVNGDELIDGRDLLRLAKFIGGYDVELQ